MISCCTVCIRLHKQHEGDVRRCKYSSITHSFTFLRRGDPFVLCASGNGMRNRIKRREASKVATKILCRELLFSHDRENRLTGRRCFHVLCLILMHFVALSVRGLDAL